MRDASTFYIRAVAVTHTVVLFSTNDKIHNFANLSLISDKICYLCRSKR